VAIILSELNALARASILATDIDRVVLEQAKAGGPYTRADVRNVPPSELQRYFSKEDDRYRVVDTLRKRIEFRERNLLSDRFEAGYDLIICRNVMIYFSDETKQLLFEKFFQSLTPDGVLFVGGTEALLGSDALGFERMGGNFYRKRADSQRAKLSA
jgi:chemotaxis protein methyltransferase CheR